MCVCVCVCVCWDKQLHLHKLIRIIPNQVFCALYGP